MKDKQICKLMDELYGLMLKLEGDLYRKGVIDKFTNFCTLEHKPTTLDVYRETYEDIKYAPKIMLQDLKIEESRKNNEKQI